MKPAAHFVLSSQAGRVLSSAAASIQASWIGRQQHRRFRVMKQAAVKIQSRWRGIVTRQGFTVQLKQLLADARVKSRQCYIDETVQRCTGLCASMDTALRGAESDLGLAYTRTDPVGNALVLPPLVIPSMGADPRPQ